MIKEYIRNLKHWLLYGKGFFDRYEVIKLKKEKKKEIIYENVSYFSGQPRNHVC